MGRFIAMDAEQKRDSDGKFGSGGGSGEKKAPPSPQNEAHHLVKAFGERGAIAEVNERLRSYKGKAGLEKAHEHWTKVKESISNGSHKNLASDVELESSNLQGEAGRQARKIARDCMSGRFRR